MGDRIQVLGAEKGTEFFCDTSPKFMGTESAGEYGQGYGVAGRSPKPQEQRSLRVRGRKPFPPRCSSFRKCWTSGAPKSLRNPSPIHSSARTYPLQVALFGLFSSLLRDSGDRLLGVFGLLGAQ